jgi:glucose/arabinose dehydrogenase
VYAVPADNPFVSTAAAKPEIWAYGLRNPWRFSFDRQTGKLWAADVGQGAWEEIDLIVSGGNYGWNAREGAHVYNGTVTTSNAIDPVWEYDRTLGQSITGGYVYRGAAIPALQGYYVYGDFVSGNVWALHTTTLTNLTLNTSGRSISSFGEDASGELYLLDYSSGSLLRIAP